MDSFVKKIFEGNIDEEVRGQFKRFGKGNYERRFLIKYNKTKKLKVQSSFEYANDFVSFVNEGKDLEFSGKILSREDLRNGEKPKKKGSSFVYEISKGSIKEFENAFFYLLDVDESGIVLKIKKSLPKPGKSAEKIDDKFCVMQLNLEEFDRVKETFFWDVPAGKKVVIEHTVSINEIDIPKDEEDPVKMREKAIRKGKLIRKINVDGKEIVKEVEFSA
tara:strand:- start:1104 stop:1760 length:657 start_codon:yes stop_codon:yes gene_type:complete